MESQLLREQKKIHRNLNGIRHMAKLPGAMVVVDVNREKNALHEARNLGIPTICLIDTDGDPNLADIPIPGNDDSMRSIDVVIRESAPPPPKAASRPPSPRPRIATVTARRRSGARRRSSRSQFRADDSAAAAPKRPPPRLRPTAA